MLRYHVNSSSPGDAYSRHCSRQLLKTLLPKEILLKLSNISFGNNVFNIIWQIYLSVFRSFRFLLIRLKSRLLQICFRGWRVKQNVLALCSNSVGNLMAWMTLVIQIGSWSYQWGNSVTDCISDIHVLRCVQAVSLDIFGKCWSAKTNTYMYICRQPLSDVLTYQHWQVYSFLNFNFCICI